MWRRGAAFVADSLTVLFINLGLVLIGGASLVGRAVDRWSPEPWGDSFVPTVVYATILLVYETAFVAARGQTPGMDLLGLEVVVTTTGEHPSVPRAVARTVPLVALRLVPGAVVGTLAMLGLAATCPIDRRRRALHDLLTGTTVIAYDAEADADAENADDDGPAAPIDREQLAATYGPRRLVDFIRRFSR